MHLMNSMTTLLRHVGRGLAGAALAAIAMAQDPAASTAEALLRGDVEAAAKAADTAADPAQRSRLQAALLPLSQRPLALLAVAEQFPDGQETDAALLAGVATIAALRDRGRAVPDLMHWLDEESGEDDGAAPPLAPLIEQYWRAVERRHAAGGDAVTLAEAQRLLRLCCVSRFGFEPARVRPVAQWALPERREDLLLRAWRRQPGRGSWAELEQVGAPDVQYSLPTASTAPIAGLIAGDWLVELASVQSHWRALRTVEVSDLDVVALVDDGAMALGVWQAGAPAGEVKWQLRRDGVEVANGSTAAGTAMAFTAPAGDDVQSELLLQGGGGSAWVALPGRRQWWWSPNFTPDPWQAHVMIDRPIYRPGDTVQGRVVLRHTRFLGTGLDTSAEGEVAVDQPLQLRAFSDTDFEVVLDGRTDRHGVYAFSVRVPEDMALGSATFAVSLRDGGEAVACGGTWARIANFRRAPMVVEVRGPEQVKLGDADPQVVLQARWASGAPAAGIAVEAECSAWSKGTDSLRERMHLVTDEQGCATVAVSLLHLQPGWARVDFTMRLPDGEPQALVHYLDVRSADGTLPVVEPSWGEPRRALEVTGPALGTVGEACRLQVHGVADARALLVVGRGHAARPYPLQLDAHGDGSVEVLPVRADWPRLDVTVATTGGSDDLYIPLHLRAAEAPKIELPARGKPGELVRCRVATGVPGTVVTVAVVDERIFAIAPDQTRDPDAELRPTMPVPRWRSAASAVATTPAQLLGSLLVDGRVPASDTGGELGPATAGPSGPASPGAGAGDVRADFRATAAFVTVVADADGIADVPFTLPDDLTTWRVRVLGVAPDGLGFFERREIVTRLPLSAEPLLPRVLRVGDEVAMPVVVDRGAAVIAAGDDAVLQVRSDGAVVQVEGGEAQVAVAAGAARVADVTLRGLAAGEASLSLGVQFGDQQDRSRRSLSVAADAVTWPQWAATSGSGEVACQAPAGVDPDLGLEVTVLGGSSAAWHAIEQHLKGYPYGCVEQTLSRLLPFFAAVRGARAHGTPPPVADKDFADRLRMGMRRLRELQVGRGGGFAFWPRGKVDSGMTALVLHGLAVVRDGGCDPQQYGLYCDPTKAPFAAAIQQLRQSHGAVATPALVLAAELAAACLRSVPADAAVHAAVAAVVDGDTTLRPGLLARLGLALVAVGDAPRAARCLQRLQLLQQPAALPLDGFPGEAPLAVQALQLELATLLHQDTGTLVGDVLLQCLRCRGSTYAEACALTALALVLKPETAAAFAVEVRAGDASRTVTLDAAHGFAARVKLAFAATCVVTGPASQQLLLRLKGQHSERASDHAPWQSPLSIDRALCRKRADATPEQLARGEDLVPIAGGVVTAGEVLWLRLAVASPTPARYVVVDCPLPAGFELVGEPWDIERFDDRFAFTLDWLGPKGTTRVLPVVALMPGKVLWPPAVVAPMYQVGCDGGSAGVVLTVAPPAGNAAPVRFTCFLQAPPARARPAPKPLRKERLDAASDTVLEARDLVDPAARQRAIDAAFAVYADEAAQDLVDTLDEVSWLRKQLDQRLRDESRGAPGGDAVSCARVAALQLELLDLAIDQFVAGEGEHTDRYVLDSLLQDLGTLCDRAVRESLLARVLHAANARLQPLTEDWANAFAPPLQLQQARLELLAALPLATPKVRREVLELLPVEDLAALPPALLVATTEQPWTPVVLRALLRSAAGRAELLRYLPDLEFLYYQSEQLAAELPDELWRQIPLRAYAGMYDFGASQGVDLARRLAEAAIPTVELQQELLQSRDPTWQSAIAEALHRRGVRSLPVAPDDALPAASWWGRALALSDDDAAAALQLLLDVDASPFGTGRQELRAFLLPILLTRGSAGQLVPVCDDLDEAQCAALFARLDAAGRRELLAGAVVSLKALPTALDAADCAALWAYGERFDEKPAAAEALAHSDVGLAFLKARIDADRDAADDDGVLGAYADALGLDADTLQPVVGEEWLALLRAVQRHGLQQPWTSALRQQLERMRRLRGVW